MFSATQLQMLVDASRRAHPGELACEDCYEQLDRFAEMMLLGKDAEAALPLVREHLDNCPGCQDEFEAFMSVLRMTGNGRKSWWRRLFRS